MYAVTKKELSDRNEKLQRDKGYPNIPKGERVTIPFGCIGKFTSVWYNNRLYTVRSADLEFDNEGFMRKSNELRKGRKTP